MDSINQQSAAVPGQVRSPYPFGIPTSELEPLMQWVVYSSCDVKSEIIARTTMILLLKTEQFPPTS